MESTGERFEFGPLPRRSIEWVRSEMVKRQLPPLIMASEMAPIEFITTGIPELDKVCKGFPVGKVTEIYGLEGVGKTSLTLQSIAGLQKAKKKVLFIDVENALNVERAKHFGIDTTKLAVSTEPTIEGVSDLILAHMGSFDAIIVDSIAAMVPGAEYEGESGEAHMGLKARVLGQFMRKVIAKLNTAKCTLIFINQLRYDLTPFSAKFFTPGGKAIPFAAMLRIELSSPKKDRISSSSKGEKTTTGKWITAKIIKSKTGAPDVEARFKLLY